ncbi:MAG TPA: hypothetical protein VKZ44_06030 [Taishania sp.]|nr:hypothetical protein [Taishania sp.]
MKEATIQYKDGLAYITFPAQKGVQTVSGIVAIKNKSGVKKELNFEWKLFGE